MKKTLKIFPRVSANSDHPQGNKLYISEGKDPFLLLFSMLSDDRFKAPSKTIPPHSAIQSLLFQMTVSSPVKDPYRNEI